MSTSFTYEDCQAKIVSDRGGVNMPLWHHPARHDGFRSIRIEFGGGDIGLATTAYSYKLTDEEKVAVARRLTAAWNFAAYMGLSTEQLESKELPQ